MQEILSLDKFGQMMLLSQTGLAKTPLPGGANSSQTSTIKLNLTVSGWT